MDAPLRNDAAAPRLLQRFGVSDDAVWHCAVSPDGNRALAISKEVKSYELASGEATLRGTSSDIVGAAPASRHGVLTWTDREIVQWRWDESANGVPLQSGSGETAIQGAAFLRGDDRFLAVTRHGSAETIHLIIEITTVADFTIEASETLWMCGAGVSTVARGLRGGAVDLCHFPPGRQEFQRVVLQGDSSASLRGVSSGSGTALAIASKDFTIRIWRTTQLPTLGAERVATLTGHTDEITGLAVTPDDRLLISSSRDRTIRIWSVPDGALLKVLTDHRDWVTHVAVNPAGTRLASCSDDGTIRLWDLESFALIGTAYGSSRFLSLAMSNDAICAGDAAGAFWILEYGEAPTVAEELARRYLVSGRVAGVGFRQFVQQFATTLGVRGSVRNLADGRIEVHVIGSGAQHAEIKGALAKGPGSAQVTSVEEEIVPLTAVEGFSVMR